MGIPVYVFTGFLDSGKSTFIQETMENPEFNDNTKSLIIALEEGDVEFDFTKYPFDCVALETPEEITTEILKALVAKHSAERVLVECNGMEKVEAFYEIMPEDWEPAQEICFADSNTILSYNDNYRELVVEKVLGCELMVFNRVAPATDIMPLHQMVRTISRQCDIAYTDLDGNTKFDDIEDPLPFDKEADAFEIQDGDFALWYRDLTEFEPDYHGKTVTFKAQIANLPENPEGYIATGRFVMTCCADDIEFMAVPCYCPEFAHLEQRTWVTVTARISVEESDIYEGIGPILRDVTMKMAEAADPEYSCF